MSAGVQTPSAQRSGTTIGAGTITSTKQYAANEELDGTGTVTKKYFAQGEQRIVSGTATNYFYTFDHLGSIREIIASDGSTISARYSYDPYGRSTKVSGSIDCDFQFAGMYFHATSGLNLTKYRAYDSNLGRWISRDPLAESVGTNLYKYCADNPVNFVDPSGLDYVLSSVTTTAEVDGPSVARVVSLTTAEEEAAAVEALGLGPEDPIADIIAAAILANALSQQAEQPPAPAPGGSGSGSGSGDGGGNGTSQCMDQPPDDDDDDSPYNPSNRDKVQDKNDKMGGEDSDPWKGKGAERGTKEGDQQKQEIHDQKKQTGRGGADNFDDDSDY